MTKQRLVLQPQQLTQIFKNSGFNKNGNWEKFSLTPDQSNYLYKVLRLKAGAEFTALDGKGGWWRAVLTEVLGQAAIIEQIPINSAFNPNFGSELGIDITLAIAMPKGNGMESIIRQATELGVSNILPLWSDRTVIRPHTPLGTSKLERWVKIAQEISEQSHRSYIPNIDAPQTFAEAIGKFDHIPISKYICVTTKPTSHLLHSLLDLKPLPSKLVIFTGAEGGWTESEITMAIAHNFIPVSLGNRILAAVTAPVMALSLVTAVIEYNIASHQC
ncbi:RNA methyltransferase, RsmE family [Synechococcus sp. PCC 7502]|uniref:RsmE family RNA methyltransferase n=1 Tax=Synechococcus sp. PCC 7502 TaxID=1173263 RepID=UPI00029FB4C0|nr:RsmE family RNA methyltransferase [Synechococcus sp. PCC 7502]AFY73715.1 RNA methyltransferase, RsmE family [Synechococcus sp. PCC 7502]